KEQYRKLKPDEQKVLANFYIAIEEIERRNSEVDEDSFQWTVAPFGGGRMHNMAEVGENALVTLGVTLDKGSYVDDDAVIKNSFSRKPVTVIASTNALVDGVEFSDNAFLSLDKDSKVSRSTIGG